MIVAETHGDLFRRALEGDRLAWDALVDRFSGMIWSVARGFGLNDASAKDVSQTVWVKLLENMDRIADPERLPGWLATTTRNEALRVAKRGGRMIPTEFEYDVEDPNVPDLDEMLVSEEETSAVVKAFKAIDEDCRQLLRLMIVLPPLSYEEISEITGRPVGSLGPTRSRCLEKLKTQLSRITGQS